MNRKKTNDNLEAIYWHIYGPIPKRPGRKPSVFKDVDILCYMWQNYKLSKSDMNFIFIRVYEKYLPYMYKSLSNDNKYDKEEVLQNYAIMVLHCLNTYTGVNSRTGASAKFNTFLFFSIKRVAPNYFNLEKPSGKDNNIKLSYYNPTIFDEVYDIQNLLD